MGQTSSVAKQEAAYFSEGESSESKDIQQNGSRGMSNDEKAKLVPMPDDHSEASASGVVFVDPTGEKMILNGSSLADDKDSRQHVVVEEMEQIDMEDDDNGNIEDDISDSLNTNSTGYDEMNTDMEGEKLESDAEDVDAGNTATVISSNSIADTNRPLPHVPSQDSSISTHVPAVLEKKVKIEVNVSSNDDEISANDNDNSTPSEGHNTLAKASSSAEIASKSQPNLLVPPETALPGLLTLSNSEIKARLNEIEFDKEMIKATSECIQVSEDIFSWYHDATIAINKKDGSIITSPSKDGEDNNSKSHMQVAMFILKVSPSIKKIRFKLVPAKLSESKFWNAVFYLIQSQGVLPTSEVGSGADIGSPPISPTINAVTTSDRGRSQTNALLQQIYKLRGQLADLESALEKASRGSAPESAATANSNAITTTNPKSSNSKQEEVTAVAKEVTPSTSKPKHAGKWIMDKESLEFLALDEEIKAKLRDGKQKRLNDVLEQMKFILDSDDVADSRGKWECCGETAYHSCSC